MRKTISTLPFKGTAEQHAKLQEAIERNRQLPGACLPVLQEAQEIYGYLPYEVQLMVAEGLDIPLEEIYGVATFYSQFALSPKGKYYYRRKRLIIYDHRHETKGNRSAN